MTHQIKKQAKAHPFDIEYSENYKIPEGADASHNNSFYFSMHNPKTRESMFWRFAQRGGDAPTEVWFVFADKAGKVYFAETDHFKKGEKLPVTMEIVKAGQQLKFSYKGNVYEGDFNNGDVIKGKKPKIVKIEMEGEFFGSSQLFDFSRHLPAHTMADALSREKWTKAFIASVRNNHQVHTEQQGTITATVKVDGQTHKFENMNAFRDHSYGKRDWGYFDRHIWILGLMENGDMFHTSFTRYPELTQLSSGFYLHEGKPAGFVKKLPSMDTLPVIGRCPDKVTYDIAIDNGKTIKVNFTREFEVQFDFGGKYTISEGVSTFEIDGLRGRGITEFGFNPDKSRWTRG
jgi:hypothetical protein